MLGDRIELDHVLNGSNGRIQDLRRRRVLPVEPAVRSARSHEIRQAAGRAHQVGGLIDEVWAF
jgi:hypothetical protein